MNKGTQIKMMIAGGKNNEEILLKVDTTLNSVRWYRSKMKNSTATTMPKIEDVFPVLTDGLLRRPRPTTDFYPRRRHKGKTVGDALKEFGLMHELEACLERLVGMKFLEELLSWNFITNAKVTSRFGQCSYTKRQIEVHATLLDKPEDLRSTFFHELAHALDKMMNGRSSHHGYPWQRIMTRGFLIPAERTGNHMTEANGALRDLRALKAVETWICTRCGDVQPIMRKRKYPASSYKHNKCGGNFRVQ